MLNEKLLKLVQNELEQTVSQAGKQVEKRAQCTQTQKCSKMRAHDKDEK